LTRFDSTFKDFKKSFDYVSTELIQVKQDYTVFNFKVQALRERVIQLEHTRPLNQLTNFDIVEESHARFFKENNLIIFNLLDSENDDASLPRIVVNLIVPSFILFR